MGARRSAAPTPLLGCSHSVMLPGDFDFIYKQDENPSSINLEEQKKALKTNMECQDKELASIQKRRRK